MIDRSTGDRTAARGKFLRAVLPTLRRFALVSAAAGIIVLAAHARTLGARLDRLAVVPGESPEGAPDPSAPGPFAPFSFGVVGPVRGDAATLERAVEALAAEGAAFVVLVGDVTAEGSADEVRRLALACRDRGPAVVAVPGSRDLSRPDFATFLCAPRWWFRHREVLVLGVSGSRPEDLAWFRGCLAAARPARATFVVTTDPAALGVVPGSATVLDPVAGARIVAVGAERITIRDVPVGSGPTIDGGVRGAALLVEPFVRTTAGHVTSLLFATALLAGGLVGVRRTSRAPAGSPSLASSA